MSVIRRLYRGETDFDFIGRRKLWFLISGSLLLICTLSLLIQGLDYSIEFRGGVSVQATVAPDGPLGDSSDREVVSQVQDALADAGVTGAQVQVAISGDDRQVFVQTKELEDPAEQQNLITTVQDLAGATSAETASERVGSRWGGEITEKAVRALLIFLVVILAFISWRFEWKMAVAAVIALIHDLIITAGVYSFTGFEVSPSTVIAILTILGYSLYDTVVVFDKVEEETTLYATSGKRTYKDTVNLAMNEVFMRGLNTSLTTLLPIGALLTIGAGLLGANTLQDLALALFVGILAGTYSSVFVATPALTLMKENEPRFKASREKILRDAKRSRPQPRPEAAVAEGEGVEEIERELPDDSSAPPAARTTSSPSGPARPKAGSKKTKRRKKR